MSVNAYLIFNGNTREAVEFYADVFGVEKPRLMLFGDMPENPEYPLTEEMKQMVMHTQIMINGTPVMFSDNFPGTPFQVGNNVHLAFVSNKEDEIRSVYDKLKADGTVQMELQATDWSKLYGNLTDKFGINWQVNHVETDCE